MKRTPTKELTQESAAAALRADVHRMIAKFDFEKAAKALRGCGWKFRGASRPPTASELKGFARKLCADAMRFGDGIAAAHGPLEVSIRHWGSRAVLTATLVCRPVWCSHVYVDGRVILARRAKKAPKKA